MKPPDGKSMGSAPQFHKTDEGFDGHRMEARRAEPDDDADVEFAELDEDFELEPEIVHPAELRPNPVELPAPINPEGGRKQSVETHRNLFCVHYDNCLDEAVKRGWNSFSCIRCGFYRSSKEEEESGVSRVATQRRAS